MSKRKIAQRKQYDPKSLQKCHWVIYVMGIFGST